MASSSDRRDIDRIQLRFQRRLIGLKAVLIGFQHLDAAAEHDVDLMLRCALHLLQLFKQLGRATRTHLDPDARGFLEFLDDRTVDLGLMCRVDRQLLIRGDVAEIRCHLRVAASAGTEHREYKCAG